MTSRTMSCFATLVLVGAIMISTFSSVCAQGTTNAQSRQRIWRGPTMGTRYQVKVILPAEVEITQDELAQEIDATLREINRQMSTYLPDSEISQFNRAESERWFAVSPATAHVVQQALRISLQSEGAYDITVGPLVQLWNFGPTDKKNLSPPKPPTDESIEKTRQHIGYQHLQVRLQPPALRKNLIALEIDLSSIAKGYAVDQIAQLLVDRKLHDYMVEIGGEIRTGGVRADGQRWKIGIERPDDSQRSVQRIVPLRNQSVATSGDYRIFFMDQGKRYSHLIDPRNGRPVSHTLASASVFASSCMEADALATTLLILGPEEGKAWAIKHQIAALLLFRRDGNFIQQATPYFDQFVNPQPNKKVSTNGLSEQDTSKNGAPGMTLLLTISIIAISLAGMAAGVILSNRRLRGSCGGLAGLRDAQGQRVCEGCTNPSPDCQGQE